LSDRYSRQTKIDNWDQEKLKKSKCIIMGAGALGSVAAVNLAQAGIGTIIIVDMDTIEFSNLNRQLLFQEEDVGKFKADIAKEKLVKINSEIKIESIVAKVQEIKSEILKPEFSGQKVILMDALDNFEGRRWINALAVNTNTPLVSGGMYAFLGNVQNIIVKELPCLECQPLISEQELQKACTPPGEYRNVEKEEIDIVDETDDFFPALGSVSSVIGGFMAQEVLKIILDMNYLKEYFFLDLRSNSFLKLPLSIRDNCIVCSEKFKISGIPVSFDKNETVKEFKARMNLLFNLNVTNTELIHNLKSLNDNSILVESLFQENNQIVIYLSSPNLSVPKKLSLEMEKSVKSKKKAKKKTTKKKKTTSKKKKSVRKKKTSTKKKK